MKKRAHLTRRFRGVLLSDRRGVASLELALIVTTILVVLFGVFDFGLWVLQGMQMQAALAAGAAYAQQFPTQYSGICSTISQALNSSNGASPAVANATTTITLAGAVTGTGNCPTGPTGVPQSGTGLTLTITISYPFSPLYFTALTTAEVTDVLQIQ